MREEFSLGASVQAAAEQIVAAGIPASEHDVMRELERLGLGAWATDNRLDLVLDAMAAIEREDTAVAAAISRDISAGRAWSLIGIAHLAVLVAGFAGADAWARWL